MAQAIARVIHCVVYYACIIGMVVLLLMMLLTTGDVIGRNIFTRPITGTFEITQYMLAVIVLLGIGYAQQVRQHVRVELFVDKMPLHGRLALDSLFTLFALIFFALVAWQGWEESFNTLHVGTVSDVLSIPSYPFELLVTVGAFLIFLELLLKLITSVRAIKGGTADEEIAE